jgi:AcrR family transcriptional regulator
MARDARITRERILKAAHEMFFRRGFARVKMSDIAKAAGLTKRTLYHHYDSKDALLEAMLEHQHEMSTLTYARNIAETDGGPEDFVRRLFEDFGKWANSKHFVGSGFTRLATELGDLRGHPAMRLARRHKRTVEVLFAEDLADRGVGDNTRLAREIWMLIEGAMIMVLLHNDSSYVGVAREAALKLVGLTGEKPHEEPVD